ncbi:MAG TPA: hypothetical protein PLI09_24140 [Candidatus Hydrogenedentes bacterium]|nr:hypothetical protein [Candidatus Hydrogenedentota bacterium]
MAAMLLTCLGVAHGQNDEHGIENSAINDATKNQVPSAALKAVRNPILDLEPSVSARDPLLVEHQGVYHYYYTAVEPHSSGFHLSLDEVRSTDLVHWSAPRRLLDKPDGFSSPGSMIRHKDRWVMALQTYPIPPGQTYGSDAARLWLMESADLEHWDAPRPIKPEGCTAHWAKTHRQIDPCVVFHNDKFWCFYKTDGQIGLLVSPDLQYWEEALPDRPVLSRKETPDKAGMENVCLVRNGEEWVMFFSPTRPGRGIGAARSDDLIDWRDVHYVDFPPVSWADNGPTAPMLLDKRETMGVWLMVFHGDRAARSPHGGALGLAWSHDLKHWTLP